MTPDQIKALIRTVPDFPGPGIQFRDVTTLISHGPGFAATTAHLATRAQAAGAQAIAGIEARGFIFGAAVAAHLGIGFVPVRKPGKLPVPTIGIDYALEYGTDRLEIDPQAISCGLRTIVIDDLIATGGTGACRHRAAAPGRRHADPRAVRDRPARPGRRPGAARQRHHRRRIDRLSRTLTNPRQPCQCASTAGGYSIVVMH